jgi:hypothetical protein
MPNSINIYLGLCLFFIFTLVFLFGGDNTYVVYIVCDQNFAFLKNLFYLSETALKLDTLVGDIEDAVSSIMNKNLRKHSSTQKSGVSIPFLFIYYFFWGVGGGEFTE